MNEIIEGKQPEDDRIPWTPLAEKEERLIVAIINLTGNNKEIAQFLCSLSRDQKLQKLLEELKPIREQESEHLISPALEDSSQTPLLHRYPILAAHLLGTRGDRALKLINLVSAIDLILGDNAQHQ